MSSSDRELLELAAKAAGYQIEWVRNFGCHYRCEQGASREQWRPLDDDGDALRLANRLHLCLCHTLSGVIGGPGTAMVGSDIWRNKAPDATETYCGTEDQDSATRRAIVRAAAEIGRSIP